MKLIDKSMNITEFINSTNLNLTFLPAQDRDKEDGFNYTTLEFIWKAIKLQGRSLFIQLNFTDPSAISPLI